MKKILVTAMVGVFLFALDIKPGKTYTCSTVGLSFKDKGQTRNIPLNDKTKDVLKKALGDIYTINVKLKNNKLSVSANGKTEVLDYRGKWNDYPQFVSKSGALVFMPDKNASSDNAAIIIAPKNLVVFYKCK